jgi:hypothetical protein
MSNEFATLDGFGNNIDHPSWGAADQQLLRKKDVSAYNDGTASLARGLNTNPREISNVICEETGTPVLDSVLTDTTWAWGQFLDHEIDITFEQEGVEAEKVPISIPSNDATTAAGGTIEFTRSAFDPYTSRGPRNPRQQRNQISAYVDASNVYGTNANRALALRALDGSGKLLTSGTDLLPLNINGLPNAGPNGVNGFLAGDIRVNETAVLIAMHTLFMREHNYWCVKIKALADSGEITLPIDADARDELIYQYARRVVSAEEQAISYEEFLPAILGKKGTTKVDIGNYKGYNDNINAGIDTIFSTSAYRFGHSMLNETVITPGVGSGTTDLKDMFFVPSLIETNGIEPYLEGLASQKMQRIDTKVVEAVRSFLFGPPTDEHLLDLASLNIQRGRDHGLPNYNKCRKLYGLGTKKWFKEVTGGDMELAAQLEQVYDGNINLIDPWIGGLAEKHTKGAHVGRFIGTVLKNQFKRLRSGDRFWYENDPIFKDDEFRKIRTRSQIRNTTLAKVVRRNTTGITVPDNMFTGN